MREKLQKHIEEVGLKYETKGDPREVGIQAGEIGTNQVAALRSIENEEAQLMDEPELVVQAILELLDLCLFKYFFVAE